MCGKAPPLANTPASGSQQATQLSPRAAPPAECRNRKSISEVIPSNNRGAHQNVLKRVNSRHEVPNPLPIQYFALSKRSKTGEVPARSTNFSLNPVLRVVLPPSSFLVLLPCSSSSLMSFLPPFCIPLSSASFRPPSLHSFLPFSCREDNVNLSYLTSSSRASFDLYCPFSRLEDHLSFPT
jgi:hypothetical protein